MFDDDVSDIVRRFKNLENRKKFITRQIKLFRNNLSTQCKTDAIVTLRRIKILQEMLDKI